MLLVQETIYICNYGSKDEERKKELLVMSEAIDEEDTDAGECQEYNLVYCRLTSALNMEKATQVKLLTFLDAWSRQKLATFKFPMVFFMLHLRNITIFYFDMYILWVNFIHFNDNWILKVRVYRNGLLYSCRG